MKVRIACLSLGFALGVAALPANAADMGYGGSHEGIRDYSGGEAIPVPAPVPIAYEKPSWYFRFDMGIGIVSDPSISGTIDDLPGYYGPVTGPADTFNIPSSWFDTDFDTMLTAGGGVGYYLGGGWRMDATVEKRSKDDVNISGSDQSETYGYGNPTAADYNIVDLDASLVADTQTRIQFDNTTKLDGTIWLANMYYDFGTHRGFTPYIGAGLGFAWNEIRQSSTANLSRCANEGGPPTGCESGTYSAIGTMTGEDKADKVSLAAAAMVGMSYDVTDITTVDLGYRYMFVQGTSAVLDVGALPTEVEIGDQHIHQLRAGLRFNVN